MKKLSTLMLALVAGGAPAVWAQTEQADSTYTTPGYEMLDEVVVESQRPVLQSDGAKLTYNVDEDPAAGSSSALEILKKVPQVSVDGDGNIRLNGSGEFKIQLNGQDNPMIKQYAKQIFEGMPASMIVKIEVITEPGAKEDAEGSAGIINIITERTRSEDGYSGTVSLRDDTRSLTPSLYGVVKKKNVTLSANINYQWGFSPQKSEQELATIYLGADNPGMLSSLVGQRMKHHYLGGNIDMSWEPNPANLFTAGANIFYIDGNLTSLYGNSLFTSPAGNPLWSFSQNGDGHLKLANVSANASYRHNFADSGANHLILSYLFNFGDTDLRLMRNYYDAFNYDIDYPWEQQDNKTFERGHTVQADYANDFRSEHHLLEAGVKGIFRHNTAFASYLYGSALGEMQPEPGRGSDILQPQNIYAAYASYTGNFGPLGVTAGLRFEHTLMGITDRPDEKESFRKRLNDWAPNASLTWSFSPASTLRLGYQRRITRPSINQVNPFELSFTPYEVNTGNPDLTSERINTLSLKYSAFGRVAGGQIGLEYNLTDNAISSYAYLTEKDGYNAIVTSYANIGKRQDVALTGFFNWNIIRNMSLAFNGRLAYNTLKAPAEGMRNHGWTGNIGANWNYTAAEVYKFSLYGAWFSRSLTVQGYSTGFYYYGLSASRDFLNDKSLSVSLSANNFLQRAMSYKSHTSAPGVIYDNTARNLRAWSVALSVSWNFGSLKAKVKETGATLKNDDINTSSNKSQAGGI